MRQLRIGFAVVAIILIGFMLFLQARPTTTPTPEPQMMTIQPGIIQSLTDLPDATPFTSAGDVQLADIEQMVTDCTDYSDARRAQMRQHIAWLNNPAEIPADMAVALGQNPSARLIFGMAGFTSTEWRLLERPVGSCLITIGQQLNIMLIALGETPPFEF